MSSRYNATLKLYRFACFNKQYQNAECISLYSSLNSATEKYSDAVACAAEQSVWKSVSANENLDLLRYGEALKYEAAALDLASLEKSKMLTVESELLKAKEVLVNKDAIAKSVERRLNSLRNQINLSDEKRIFDQQNDLLNASRSGSR